MNRNGNGNDYIFLTRVVLKLPYDTLYLIMRIVAVYGTSLR